jgi:hypothetical protein
MDTTIVSENTVAGKSNARHGSSDCLTPLKAERESVINPAAFMKAREWMTAFEMGMVNPEIGDDK